MNIIGNPGDGALWWWWTHWRWVDGRRDDSWQQQRDLKIHSLTATMWVAGWFNRGKNPVGLTERVNAHSQLINKPEEEE